MKTNTIEEIKSLKALESYFKTQRTCLDYLAWKRWNGIPQCPYCSNNKVYRRGDGRYACAGCGRSFSVLVGTVFQNTKLPLLTWFKAIFLVSNSRQGISSCQLSLILGITQKTAWFILQKIRVLLQDSDDGFFDEVQGTIAVKTSKKGSLFKMRVPYPNHKLHPEVLKHVADCSRVLTDCQICFQSLIESERPEYNIEDPYPLLIKQDSSHKHLVLDAFWIQLKRMVAGIYHFISASYFHRYVYEALFRKKHVKDSIGKRFSLVFDNIEHVLPYAIVSPRVS